MRHAIHAPRGIHSFREHATPKKIIRSTTSHCDKIIDRAHHARRFDRPPFCQPERWRVTRSARDDFPLSKTLRLARLGCIRWFAVPRLWDVGTSYACEGGNCNHELPSAYPKVDSPATADDKAISHPRMQRLRKVCAN